MLEYNAMLPANLQPSDCIAIQSLQSVANTNHQLRPQILRSGARIWDESEERELSEEECSILLKFVMLQESLELSQNKQKHKMICNKVEPRGP